MLPEQFFTAGPSMQDISRDDFTIINGADVAAAHSTDKNMCPIQIYKSHNTSPLNSIAANLPQDSNNELSEVQSFVSAKLEDINTVDLFPSNSASWRQYQIQDIGDHRLFLNTRNSYDCNSAKLLLQGSDDPLISHGANSVLSNDEEHPADFANSLTAQRNNYLQQPTNKKENQERLSKLLNEDKNPQRIVKSGCSNLTKQQLKVKANLMSARNQQQQQQLNQNNTASLTISTTSLSSQKGQRNQKTKNKKGTIVKLRFHHQALPPEYLSHYEATQGLQRICKNPSSQKTSNQRSSPKTTNNFQRQSQPRNSHENVRSWLQKIAEIQRTANASKLGEENQTQSATEKNQRQQIKGDAQESQKSLSGISSDANNNHKQATHKDREMPNTCCLTNSRTHGGQLPAEYSNRLISQQTNYSDLPYMGEITLDNCKPRRGRKPKKADICHLIYKNYGTILPKKSKSENCYKYSSNSLNMKSPCFTKEEYEQPLNLCLRDQPNDSYSISSGDELSETNSTCPTPISTPFDSVRDSMLANNLQKSLNNLSEHNENEKPIEMSKNSKEKITHPIAMCYKKMLESGVLLHNANGLYQTITKDNQLALKIPVSSGVFVPQQTEKPSSSPVESNAVSSISSMPSDNSLINTTSLMPNQQLTTPQKRKRSAIFIPPMNIENTNNPATEVSICKFKFTGGSKPSLQEKKMISVDAGGNYSYFSGTGDKASRGYEYFPRESLQHTAGLLPGVNCTGQKFYLEKPPTLHGSSNDSHQISKSATSSAHHSAKSVNVSMDSVSTTPLDVSKNEAYSISIKENSSSYSSSSPTTLTTTTTTNLQLKRCDAPTHPLRKFSQKEKLEKTFKEQGFLIQTQQLESAEGATYCKFRQLKKLTRYLFRNWKDYLPPGIQENINATAFKPHTDTSLVAIERVNLNALKQASSNSL